MVVLLAAMLGGRRDGSMAIKAQLRIQALTREQSLHPLDLSHAVALASVLTGLSDADQANSHCAGRFSAASG